jgi:hypothetical protein
VIFWIIFNLVGGIEAVRGSDIDDKDWVDL